MGDADRTTVIQGWIEQLQAGESSAREGLFRSVHDRLRLLARKMLWDYPGVARWEEPDDVLQNVFIRLERALCTSIPSTALDFLKLAAAQIRRELIDMARHYGGPQGLGAHHFTPAGIKITWMAEGDPPETTLRSSDKT
jgi:DNA-directed RNA polymerase specialized sigma24 family protein